jgi:hypothetical protein
VRRSLLLALVALALPFVILAVAIAAAVKDDSPTPTPAVRLEHTPAPTATAAPPLSPLPAAGPGLAVGVTEYNPNLVSADKEPPAPWSTVRDALGALHPAFYRLVIEWNRVQPTADQPPNLDHLETGCMREVQPCLPWGGVRDQLRALASRQREGGWQGLVVITGTPDWAAQPPSGCERDATTPRARLPRPEALAAYKALVAAVLQAAQQEGANLRYWSAWNEPNLPQFISPQRAACDPASPSLSPGAYASFTRTLMQALAEAPGDQEIVLGETAGILRSTKLTTSVPEFIAGLPRDIVCASTVWTQHAYIGGPDPVEEAAAALAQKGCPQPHTIWITETGVGPAPKAFSNIQRAARCGQLHDRLVHWFNDPRVTVAFQYTVREDDRFPTGLYSTDLTAPRPALAEWEAWGGARAPTAPPPTAAC